MIDRFDHAVIAVADLDNAVEAYRRLGFTVQPGGHHTGEGTHNALVRFGLDYLELMAVRDYSEARRRPFGSQLLDLLSGGGGGLIGYVLAGRELEVLAHRMAESGLDPVGPISMERQRPDGRAVRWKLLFPRGQRWGDMAPFVIEWEASDSAILAEAEEIAHPNGAVGVDGLTVRVSEFGPARDLYESALGFKMSVLGGSRARAMLGTLSIDIASTEGGTSEADGAVSHREGVHEVRLAVRHIDTALATIPGLTRGTDGLYRIPVDAALGARIALRSIGESL